MYIVLNRNLKIQSVKERSQKLSVLSNLSVNPNPFQSRTRIFFDLPAAGKNLIQIKLEVINLEGKVVQKITEGEQTAGKHQWELSAHGKLKNSGVYFVRLQYQGNTVVRKVLFLK